MFSRSSSSWFFFQHALIIRTRMNCLIKSKTCALLWWSPLFQICFILANYLLFQLISHFLEVIFLFCFHHIQSTHTNWGGILLVVVQLVFRSVFVNTLQKLTLSQTNRTAFFLFCATCSFIFSVYLFTFWRNIPTVWVCVCVFFCLTSTQTERSISFFLPIFYEITTNLLRSNFLFLENKIDLLAIIGGAICVSLGDFIFFRFRYLQDDVPLVFSNFV